MPEDNSVILNDALENFELSKLLNAPGLFQTFYFKMNNQTYELYEGIGVDCTFVYGLVYNERMGRHTRVENSGKPLDEWMEAMNL